MILFSAGEGIWQLSKLIDNKYPTATWMVALYYPPGCHGLGPRISTELGEKKGRWKV